MGVGLAGILGGAASGVAGGIGNIIANSSAQDRANALQNEGLQQWINTAIPDPAEQKLALQQFVVQGKLDPKLESSISTNPSQFSKVIANPTYVAAQNNALSSLQNEGNQGGLSLQDKAGIQQATLAEQARNRGNQEGIDANLAQRGMGTSGFGLASKLQSQQGSQDQLANQSLSVAGDASTRALQAIQDAGNLGSQLNNQDFQQQAQKASAADKINMFNTENMQNVQQRNVAAQNTAQATNISNAQNVANNNVNQNNTQQEYNSKLLQQQYENQLQKNAGMTGQYNTQANQAIQQGQNQGNAFSNIGTGLAGAGASVGNYASNQNNYNLLNNYLKSKNSNNTDDEEY